MNYTLENLFQSINDIFEQVDEGRMTLDDGETLALKCCKAFTRMTEVKQWKKEHINE